MDKLKFTEGAGFLIFEILFCLSFITLCEVPNWSIGPRQTNTCTDRWMFTAGVFFPSAVGNMAGSSKSLSRTSRDKQQ